MLGLGAIAGTCILAYARQSWDPAGVLVEAGLGPRLVYLLGSEEKKNLNRYVASQEEDGEAGREGEGPIGGPIEGR